ncbi:hypothetical protein SETIT_2G320100v2 [Setaria italica]|uniref:Uncharacterized protein n=1 Tax=Setaria italica TaxID=4555 RepID=A0A368Q5H3_SETIT|nr:hypothetical protein SETIT_2G320100v2 [Setaria italica]
MADSLCRAGAAKHGRAEAAKCGGDLSRFRRRRRPSAAWEETTLAQRFSCGVLAAWKSGRRHFAVIEQPGSNRLLLTGNKK